MSCQHFYVVILLLVYHVNDMHSRKLFYIPAPIDMLEAYNHSSDDYDFAKTLIYAIESCCFICFIFILLLCFSLIESFLCDFWKFHALGCWHLIWVCSHLAPLLRNCLRRLIFGKLFLKLKGIVWRVLKSQNLLSLVPCYCF